MPLFTPNPTGTAVAIAARTKYAIGSTPEVNCANEGVVPVAAWTR